MSLGVHYTIIHLPVYVIVVFVNPPPQYEIVDGTCIWDSGMYLPAERDEAVWGSQNTLRERKEFLKNK